MIKIYGNPVSTCTRKVLMTLAETNTPFEMQVIDFAKGEHKQEAHLRRQPFGRIPTLEHDGFEMFESRAISRYLNEIAKAKLVPSAAKAHAKMEQWISVETSEFSAHAMKYIYEYTFKREQPPEVLEAARKALEVTCAAMEKQLAETPFLAGAEFSLAEVCFMPYIEYAMATPLKDTFAKFPRMMAWWNKIAERPTWRKAIGKA